MVLLFLPAPCWDPPITQCIQLLLHILPGRIWWAWVLIQRLTRINNLVPSPIQHFQEAEAMTTNCHNAAANGETGQWPTTKHRDSFCVGRRPEHTGGIQKRHISSTDFYEVPLCVFSFDLSIHSCSILSSSAGPLCVDGFTPASSLPSFLLTLYIFLKWSSPFLRIYAAASYLWASFQVSNPQAGYLLIRFLHGYNISDFKLTFLQSYFSKCVACYGFLSNGSHYHLGWKSPSRPGFIYTLSIDQWSMHAFFSLPTLQQPMLSLIISHLDHCSSLQAVLYAFAHMRLNLRLYSTLIPSKYSQFMNPNLSF